MQQWAAQQLHVKFEHVINAFPSCPDQDILLLVEYAKNIWKIHAAKVPFTTNAYFKCIIKKYLTKNNFKITDMKITINIKLKKSNLFFIHPYWQGSGVRSWISKVWKSVEFRGIRVWNQIDYIAAIYGKVYNEDIQEFINAIIAENSG